MSLEEKVNDKESSGFMKKAFKLGFNIAAAAATTALSLATVGTAGIWVGAALGGGKMIGNLMKGNSFYESLNEGLIGYSTLNAVIWPMSALGDATFPLFSNYFSGAADVIARSLYAIGPYAAAFVGIYSAADHLIRNYLNPTGITKSISDNFLNRTVRVGGVYAPGLALVANGVSSIAGIPTFALNALPAEIYNSVKPVAHPAAKNHSSLPSYSPAPAHAH